MFARRFIKIAPPASAALLFLCVGTSAPAEDKPTEVETALLREIYALEDAGEWKSAQAKATELLPLVLRNHGEASVVTLSATNELAITSEKMGLYAEAIKALRQGLKICDELGADGSTTAAQLRSNLSAVLQNIGDFEAALESAEKAVEIHRARDGGNVSALSNALNNLANIHWTLGEFSKAEAIFRKAAAPLDASEPDEVALLGKLYSNLGGVRNQAGRDGFGELEKALEIRLKSRGDEHPETLETLLFMGEFHHAKGEYEMALELFERCHTGRVAAFGEVHMETAEAQCRVGETHLALGKPDKAGPWLDRSLKNYREALGENHIDLRRPLFAEAMRRIQIGNREGATEVTRRLEALEIAVLESIDRFATEPERLAYLDLVRSHHLYATLGDAERLAESVARTHGVVLDGLLRERRLKSLIDEGNPLGTELLAARARFREAFLERGGGSAEGLEAAVEEVSQWERRLSAQPSTQDFTFDLDALQENLDAGALTVQFLEFQRADKRLEGGMGAIVIGEEDVQFLDLGSGAIAGELVSDFLKKVKSPGGADDTEVATLAKKLHGVLLDPVLGSAGKKITRLTIIPGGPLSFLPFGCLLDAEGKFAIESVEIHYLSNLREFLNPWKVGKAVSALVVGNPHYGATVAESKTPGGFPVEFFGEGGLRSAEGGLVDLPGALEEANQLSVAFRAAGLQVELRTEGGATERGFAALVDGRGIIHLATHGVFLPRRESSATLTEFHNPMFQGWLALAGSRHTVAQWRAGMVPAAQGDGILMASEVAALPFSDCHLVCLSACESGLGEATRSGGILGLRRGFRTAGADHLLVTLWNIADEATAHFMRDFYANYLSTGDAPGALIRTKRKWLAAHRKEHGLQAAIFLSGPFVLSR